MEAIPEVLCLSDEELKDLLESDEKLDAFIEGLPDIAGIFNRCLRLSEENHMLANKNIELKNDFEKSRDLTLMKVQELTSLRANFEHLTSQHQDLTEKLAPANLQELTLIAASQSEEESEEIAESFLDKSVPVSTFLNTYLGKRVESHTRKFKGERLGTQLQELHKAGF